MLVVVSFFVNGLGCCRCSWRFRNKRSGRGSIDGEGDPDSHSPGEEQVEGNTLNDSLLSVSLVSDRSSLYDANKLDDSIPKVLVTSKNQFILWFAGLRGAMSFALVENIPVYDIISHEGTKFKVRSVRQRVKRGAKKEAFMKLERYLVCPLRSSRRLLLSPATVSNIKNTSSFARRFSR